MIFETFHPEQVWGQHIEQVIYYKDLNLDHSIERVVPSGHAFLLFALDGQTRKIYNEMHEPIQEFADVWISGPHSQALNISVHPNSEMLVVQFHVCGARPFFHQSLSDIANRVVSAQTILGSSALELCSEIKGLADASLKFDRLCQWLDAKYDEEFAPPSWIRKAVSRMAENPYSQHHDIVRELAHSHKHFIHQTKLYAGLTPKTLHRLFRFTSLLQRIQGEETVHWADISYETGYADQAHFAKDFFRFSGFNPSRFIKDFGQYPAENFFPLA